MAIFIVSFRTSNPYNSYMSTEPTIRTEAKFIELTKKAPAVLFYFSTLSCSVGEALEPKVRDLVSAEFPKIEFVWIDMNAAPEILGSQQVFVEPTILLYVQGKEYLRRSRNIHVAELQGSIRRIYDLAFSE